MKTARFLFASLLSASAVMALGAASTQAQFRLLPGDSTIAAAATDQTAPAIAQGGDKELAVWVDNRPNPYGSYTWSEYETSRDIYGMRFDATGNPIDSLPIAIFTGRSIQDNPKVAWNGANWLVVFESYDIGGTGYYYQKSLAAVRVSSTGQVLDAQPIKIYGIQPSGGSYWSLASDGTNWVIVAQGTSASADIVALRVSSAGVLLDPPTRSVLKATYYGRSNIQLAFAGGVFLTTFNDAYNNGTDDTKAVRFDSNLNLLDASPISFLPTPLGALAGNGNSFYAVWSRQEPDYSVHVVGSRVSLAGVRLDGNGVNISGTKQPYAYAVTGVTWDGVNWRVTWGEFATTYIARVNSSGAVLDPGSVAVPGVQTGPTAGTGDGGIQLVWLANANNNNDVYSAKISSGNTAGPSRILSIGAPRQLRADIATSGNGYMVVYHSATASQIRVSAQPLDAAGNPLTSGPVQLDSGIPNNGPGYPSIAWNGAVYLVAWSTPNGVVAQRLSPTGTKIDATPFLVMTPALGPTGVAALGSDFLVTGLQIGFNIQYIFPVAARVNGSGTVLDNTPMVLGNSFVSRRPAVVALGGRWLVAWIRNATHDDPYANTQGAFISPDGAHTNEFTIHGPFSTAGGNGIFELALASSGSQALMIQPQELSSGVETDLLCRLIQADGTVSAMTNLTPWIGNQYRPRATWDGANFIVVYQDQKNRLAPSTLDQLDARSDLFGMRISPTGTIIDPQGFVFSASALGETDPNITASSGVGLIAGSLMMNDAVFANYRINYEVRRTDGPVAVINASQNSGDAPMAVGFNSVGSTGTNYFWNFGDGSTSTAANPTHLFAVAGEYLVTLRMTNGAGAQTTQAVMIEVTNPNQIPVAVARANKSSGNAPLDVIFYADGSYDPDGFVGNIEWLFSDGGNYWGSTAYHTFTTTGNHNVILRVYDSRGAIGTANLTINVGGVNQPPVANAGATPTSGSPPLTVQFSSAGSSDPDGSIVAYEWTFGDAFGTHSNEPNPTYRYDYPGTYPATLTVWDNNNVSSSDTVIITVNAAGNTVMRSSAITLNANLQGSRKVSVTGNVSVTNAAGAAVSGAAVYCTWTKPDGTSVTQTATTGQSGSAKFNTSGGRGTYRLTVVDIRNVGFVFDPTNSVLSKSITK